MMRSLMVIGIAVLLASLAGLVVGLVASGGTADEDQIMEIVRGLQKVYENEDIAMFMSISAGDCVAAWPGGMAEGKEAVKATIEGEFANWDDMNVTYTDMVVKVSGDAATVTFDYQLDLTNLQKGGARQVAKGEGSLDLKKTEGAWKISKIENTVDSWETVFVRLTIAQIKSGKIDELIRIYGESIVPAAKAQKGYKAAYLLTDREAGKAISVTIWDSQEYAIANEQSGYYQEQVAKAKDCFAGAPVREGYEIAVTDVK